MPRPKHHWTLYVRSYAAADGMLFYAKYDFSRRVDMQMFAEGWGLTPSHEYDCTDDDNVPVHVYGSVTDYTTYCQMTGPEDGR